VRKIVLHMHTSLDNRIANAEGALWEPFPWGDEEMTYLNEHFRAADTWAMGRHVYEAVVPWWETVARGETPDDVAGVSAVDRDFAQILAGMTKVVFSRTLAPAHDRVVIHGDLAAQLGALKRRDGRTIVLSCGPAALAPLATAPGLIDEYLIVVHPAVLRDGPRLFGDVRAGLGLRLIDSKTFSGGCVVLHYEPLDGP
jgi:dihydrofolate reductase